MRQSSSRRRVEPSSAVVANQESTGARVVYAALPFLLARVQRREGDRCRVTTADGRAFEAGIDTAVDPALVDEAATTGARVIVEMGESPTIAGVLLVSRPLSIGRDRRVDAEVESFTVSARESATLKTSSAFVQVKAREVELYGEKVLARARNLVKLAAAMIRLN